MSDENQRITDLLSYMRVAASQQFNEEDSREWMARHNALKSLIAERDEWRMNALALKAKRNELLSRLGEECDHLSSSEGQLRDLVLKAFTLEVFEDGSIGIQTQAHKWICDMNLMRETEIAVRKIAVDEMVRRIESIKKKQVAVLSGGQKCKET